MNDKYTFRTFNVVELLIDNKSTYHLNCINGMSDWRFSTEIVSYSKLEYGRHLFITLSGSEYVCGEYNELYKLNYIELKDIKSKILSKNEFIVLMYNYVDDITKLAEIEYNKQLKNYSDKIKWDDLEVGVKDYWILFITLKKSHNLDENTIN